MFANPRVRAVLGAGTALAVVAAIGVAAATSSAAAAARYVTAEAATGEVIQTYTATGTITRRNTAEATFRIDGTVRSVAVAVGDEVEAGDTLATLNKAALQLAVLNAQTSLARAEATLYAAEHPSSTRSTSGGGATGSTAGGGGPSAVTVDVRPLNEAAAAVNLAVLDESDKCRAIFEAILPEATATPTTSPEATAAPTATGDPEAAPGAEATTTPEAAPSAEPTASPTSDAGPTPSAAPDPDEAPEPSATASQLAAVGDTDFTEEQLQACADARAAVLSANEQLQAVVQALSSPSGGGKPGGGSASSGSSSGSTATVSASAVAAAEAELLAAEQELAAARADLADATLAAPISGTVAAVSLAKGKAASSGSVTIVGKGSALVTFELPLKPRALVEVGEALTVTPAGATTTLAGRIAGVATLATSGTSGDGATYTTEVSVSDPDGLLATGAKAAVVIPVQAETGVLRVPASAVTPTGTGTATVQVVTEPSATNATTVEVQTGATGGGWVQVTSGLRSGQLVVLADATADIPSNSTSRRTVTIAR